MDKCKQPFVGCDGQGAAASQPSGASSRLSCLWQQKSRWLVMDHRAVICGGGGGLTGDVTAGEGALGAGRGRERSM